MAPQRNRNLKYVASSKTNRTQESLDLIAFTRFTKKVFGRSGDLCPREPLEVDAVAMVPQIRQCPGDCSNA